MSPHIPLNEDDERSCYANLLLHVPWPLEGELGILGTYESAIAKFKSLAQCDNVPTYLKQIMQRIAVSEAFIADRGRPNDDDDDNSYSDRSNNEFADQDPWKNVPSDTDVDSDSEGSEHSRATSEDDDNSTTNTIPTYSEDVFNVTKHYQTYKNFIRTQSDIRLNEYYKANQISASGEATSSTPRKQNVENYDERIKVLNEELQLLNHPDAIYQKKAYQKAIAHLTGENQDQLRMFLSGEGGTGKSKVLKLIIEFARLHFGRTEGHHGAVIPMGPTGH